MITSKVGHLRASRAVLGQVLAVSVRQPRYRLIVSLWGRRGKYWDLGCPQGDYRGQRRDSQARWEAEPGGGAALVSDTRAGGRDEVQSCLEKGVRELVVEGQW